jgi:hypothetical protein
VEHARLAREKAGVLFTEVGGCHDVLCTR